MTIFYVRKTGNDANNGQSPALAWATIGHALAATPNGAGTNPSAGDTIYVGAGVYREQVAVNGNSGTAGAYISVVGDIDGSQTGDPPGLPRWTAYDVNDTTAPSGGQPTINLNGRNYCSFRQFYLQGGKSACFASLIGPAIGLTVQDCVLVAGTPSAGATVSLVGTVDTNNAWLFDRCRFVQTNQQQTCTLFNCPTSTVADYNVGITIQNSLFFGGIACIQFAPSGANTFKPGGGVVTNCHLLWPQVRGVWLNGATWSTAIPMQVNNSLIFAQTCLVSGAVGQLTESYNVLFGNAAYSNVTAGAGSISNGAYASLLNFDQDFLVGRSLPGHFFSPTPDSPLLNFGAAASPPLVDLLNRQRPAGGVLNAVGCLEAHNLGVQNSTTVPSGTTNSLQVAGPGDQDLLLPVTAVAATVSIQVYRDGGYGAGAKPTVELVAAPELGVGGQSVADPGPASAWNTIALASFTPTTKGVVRLRLHSYSAATGNCYFGNVAVA
jgi:hypothetical protein